MPTSTDRAAHTILVVDDNAVHRYALVKVLVKAGYKVLEAVNGTSALQSALGMSGVLLDVFLPDIDGRDVCRKLRSNPSTASIPIIHVSSVYVTFYDRAVCAEAGSNAFLESPVAPDELLRTVDAHVFGN